MGCAQGEGWGSRGQKGQRRGVIKPQILKESWNIEKVSEEESGNSDQRRRDCDTRPGGDVKTPNVGWGFPAIDRKASLCRED